MNVSVDLSGLNVRMFERVMFVYLQESFSDMTSHVMSDDIHCNDY